MEALWHQNTRRVYEQIIGAGLFNSLLDLFFGYKWNNLLHDSVMSIIVAGVQLQCSEFVYPHLCRECHIVERILAAEDENKAYNKESSVKGGSNLGNIGHITTMSWILDNNNNNNNNSNNSNDDNNNNNNDDDEEEDEDSGGGRGGVSAYIDNETLLHKWKDYISNVVSPRLSNQSKCLGSENENKSDDNDDDDYYDNSMSAYGSFGPSDFYSRVNKEAESEEEEEEEEDDDDDDDNNVSGYGCVSNDNDNNNNNNNNNFDNHLTYGLGGNQTYHCLPVNVNYDVSRNDRYDDDEEEVVEGYAFEDEMNEDDFDDCDDAEDASDAMIHTGAVNLVHHNNDGVWINEDGERTFFEDDLSE